MEWFSVRCVFRYPTRHGWLYEERVTLWQATTFDGAITQAEAEASEYVDGVDGEYVGLAQAYVLPAPPGPSAEVFSLIRESQLAPGDYLTRFFDTGDERQYELEDEQRPEEPRRYGIEPQDPPLTDDQVARQYAAWCRSEKATDKRDRRTLAWNAVHGIAEADPVRALQLVTRVVEELGDDANALSSLGADVVEDLLAEHGDGIIDAVEQQAALSPGLRQALASVWIFGNVPDEIALRVEQAAGTALRRPRDWSGP